MTAPSAVGERAPLLTPGRLTGLPLGFLVVHVALGPILTESSAVSTAYAGLTVAVAVTYAAFGRKLEGVVAVAAYVAVSDVLWRATDARFFYEGGKYVVCIILFLAIVRFARASRRMPLPFAYFALLVPSALLTIDALGLEGAREQLSFNLSGPLTLAISAAFFLQVRCSWGELRRMFFVMLGPIVALASVASYLFMTQDLVFTGEGARLAETGEASGFGPNQVSATLGLGALVCLLLLLRERRNIARLIEFAFGLWLFGQGLLTFSRGGVVNFAIAGGVIVLLQVARGRGPEKTLAVLFIVVIAGIAVFNRLDTYTGGTLEQRFTERSTTHRSAIATTDLEIWSDHAIVGVGPGRSPEFREGALEGVAAHTEFTRTLAEHGALGLIALLCLGVLAGRAFLTAPNAWSRAVTLALALWALADMSHSAMRTAAPAFVFGLAMVKIDATRAGTSERTASARLPISEPSG